MEVEEEVRYLAPVLVVVAVQEVVGVEDQLPLVVQVGEEEARVGAWLEEGEVQEVQMLEGEEAQGVDFLEEEEA